MSNTIECGPVPTILLIFIIVRLDTPSNIIFNLNLKFEQFRQKDHLSHITVAKDLESC